MIQIPGLRFSKTCLPLFCLFWIVLLVASESYSVSLNTSHFHDFMISCGDSVSAPSNEDTLHVGQADSMKSRADWDASAEKSFHQVSQDALQLVEAVLPVLPVHSGDFGLPSFFGASGLPPRLVDIFVDGIRWMPGVYGLVDASGIPEVLAGEISLQRRRGAFATSLQHRIVAFSFTPTLFDFRTPISLLNIVRGPFGGDAIRAMVARRLSAKMRFRFTLDEANSSGQFANLPYDGQKLSAELTYMISNDATLRYHYFDSRNESGALLPFYPEGLSGDSAGIGKEQRFYHGLEFAWPAIFVRPFYWNLRNEFRSSTMQSRHRTERFGIEGGWQKTWQNFRSALHVEVADDRIVSTSISVSRSQSYRLRGEMDWAAFDHFRAGIAATLHKEADWPAALDLDFDIAYALTKNFEARGVFNRRAINPAPAEFANTIDVLQSNSALQPAELQRGAVELRWQTADQRSMQIQFALNRFNKPFGFTTSLSAGTANLINDRREDVPSLDFLTTWRVSRKLIIGGHGSMMFQNAATLFWYQNVRRSFARGYVEFLQDFFSGDLTTRLRFAVRHYGESFAPVYSSTAWPEYIEVPGAQLFEVQLFLRHGNTLFYFSFENILNRKFEWRPGISAPGYFLKWGARVDLKN